MTVTKTASSATFFGNGSATVFPLQFYVSPTDTLRLFKIAEGGTLSPVLSGFSFVGNKTTETTALTFSTAPSSGAEYYAVRETEQSQRVSLKGQVSYNPEVVEGVWDKLTRIAQELSAGAGKVLRATTNLRPINLVADSVLSVDSSGENVVCGPSVRDITAAAARAEVAVDAAARAEVAASVLGAEACTFHPRDYIPAAQMAHILNGNTALQDEAIVTAGLRAMHDAAMAWLLAGTDRVATMAYAGTYAINDEIFSETFADDLWSFRRDLSRWVVKPTTGLATFVVKNWLTVKSIRRSGLYKVVSPVGEVSSGGTGPIVVTLKGQSNAVAAWEATDGTFKVSPLVKIWDAALGAFATADIENTSYQITYNVDTGERKTVGGGRNNLAVAFCHRLAEETGRQVCLIINGFGGLSITNWTGSGAASQLYRAYKKDVTDALAAIGQTKVHYMLWQQGEADGDDASYGAKVQTLVSQLKAESFWGSNTYFIAGEPCQSSTRANLPDLLAQVRLIETDGDSKTLLAQSEGLPYISDGTNLHFSGAGLWSLGYGRYFQALGPDPAQRGVGDVVPAAVFRWEQKSGNPLGPHIERVRIVGTAKNDAPGDDPIGVKTMRVNAWTDRDIEVRDLTNVGVMHEGMINSRGFNPLIKGCGFQPTEALGGGSLPADVRFDVTGTAITASEPVFVTGHTGALFSVHGAGPNGHAHSANITVVDATHATFASAAPTAVTEACGSFQVPRCTGSAGSKIVTLARFPEGVDFVGRYVTVLFAGYSGTADMDHLTTRVIAQDVASRTLHLADALRFDVSATPLIVAPAVFFGRTAGDYARNGGQATTAQNDVQIYGLSAENPAYNTGATSAVGLVANNVVNCAIIGGKIHGQSSLYNNFASNFAIALLDDCDGLALRDMQLKWGKWSPVWGSVIVSGQNAAVTLPDVSIGNSFANYAARHLYLAPRSASVKWSVGISGVDQSGNGWPNTQQGLVRYGDYGTAAHLTAIGALIRGSLSGETADEPVTRRRALRSASAGFGMEPTTSSVVSIAASANYTPIEFWLDNDRFLWRQTLTGLSLGRQIGSAEAAFPVQIDWDAPGNSLALSANYAQIRKPRLTGVPAYADNAAALAGGLVAGETYQVSGTNPRQLAIVY